MLFFFCNVFLTKNDILDSGVARGFGGVTTPFKNCPLRNDDK